jgi:parallel beta-helix repeat protein
MGKILFVSIMSPHRLLCRIKSEPDKDGATKMKKIAFGLFMVCWTCSLYALSLSPVGNGKNPEVARPPTVWQKPATPLYLSPNGSDKNQGTKYAPLASLKGARDRIRELRRQGKIKEAIQVKIRSGTYYMSEPLLLSSEDTGSRFYPVIFTAESEERPVFCGGIKIGNFEAISPNLWRARVPETVSNGLYFEQLYVNGQRRFRAQTPNRKNANQGNFFRVKRVTETIINPSAANTAQAMQKVELHDSDAQFLADISDQESKDTLAVFNHKWDNTRKHIRSIDIKKKAFYISGQKMKSWNQINDKSRYVIENYRKALDAPGEWYLQRDGYLYYIPMPGETLANTEFIAPVIEHFLKIKGSKNKPVRHIYFSNIRFENSAYHTPAAGNEPQQAAASIDAAIMIDFAENIKFENCDIAHTGAHGIWFRERCSASRVEHCHLYDLGGGGVKIGRPAFSPDEEVTQHIVVHNNIIQHGGYVFPCAVGLIIFHGKDNEITHNDIADFRYSSISAGWVWGYAASPSKRNKIAFNHLHHLGWGEMCDMGGVYTLGASEGTTITNNVIHHIYSFAYGGWGLYTDEGSHNVLMEKNLVYECKDSGFHQHYGKENTVRNNIFASNMLAQLQLSRAEKHSSLSFTNNIVYHDKGVLYKNPNTWRRAQVNIDYNCYWDPRTRTPDFCGLTFDKWKKLNRDVHSVIENPLFVNPAKFDFNFVNLSVVRKIGFEPFDYTKAGVYGEENWVNKARLAPKLLRQFDEVMLRNFRK